MTERSAPDLSLLLLPVRDPVWMQSPSADLALRVAFDGYRPPPPELPSVCKAVVSGTDLPSPVASSFEVVEGDLEVHLLLPFTAEVAARFFENAPPPGGPTQIALANGTEVSARLAVPAASSTAPTPHPGEVSQSYSLLDWEASRGTPSLWVGTIPLDVMSNVQGNLLVHDPERGGSVRNLLLDGHYSWSIIEIDSETATVVIIDTHRQPLDASLLTSDFFALQLTLGQRLTIPWLAGVDEHGNAVCWRGYARLGRTFATRGVAKEPPIPLRVTDPIVHWAPVFFSVVARALVNDQALPSWIVHGAYLDSLDESLDSAYLKLQVALEAICNGVGQPGRVLVTDSKAWARWVDEHRAEIARHAVAEECVERLVAKVKSAQHAPSTHTVEDALAVLKITPPPEILAEVPLRNQSVHRFLMNKKDVERNLLGDWDRVRKIRCVLMAVYAKLIGYTGPIHGWERDSWGHSVPAPWWQRTAPDSRRWFAYVRKQDQGKPS